MSISGIHGLTSRGREPLRQSNGSQEKTTMERVRDRSLGALSRFKIMRDKSSAPDHRVRPANEGKSPVTLKRFGSVASLVGKRVDLSDTVERTSKIDNSFCLFLIDGLKEKFSFAPNFKRNVDYVTAACKNELQGMLREAPDEKGLKRLNKLKEKHTKNLGDTGKLRKQLAHVSVASIVSLLKKEIKEAVQSENMGSKIEKIKIEGCPILKGRCNDICQALNKKHQALPGLDWAGREAWRSECDQGVLSAISGFWNPSPNIKKVYGALFVFLENCQSLSEQFGVEGMTREQQIKILAESFMPEIDYSKSGSQEVVNVAHFNQVENSKRAKAMVVLELLWHESVKGDKS